MISSPNKDNLRNGNLKLIRELLVWDEYRPGGIYYLEPTKANLRCILIEVGLKLTADEFIFIQRENPTVVDLQYFPRLDRVITNNQEWIDFIYGPQEP